MAAANTDLLRKKKSLFSTTLSSGISAVDTSMTLASTSGLPTDTAITLTLDRVDANGVSTPSLRERVTGVVSGSVVGNLVRGEDGDGGTGKVHSAGAVIEDIWEAESWNDMLTVLMATHEQVSGRIKNETAYAADAGANDIYAITLTPAPAAYTTGMIVYFKANTANTGACTLNVNTLGAKTIKKNYNSDLADNDILANQLVAVIYDGTNFQLLSPINASLVTLTGTQTLTNKTLTSPVINVGSDAHGDIYFRNTSGVLARLAPGTSGKYLKTQGAAADPMWDTPAAALSSTVIQITRDLTAANGDVAYTGVGFVPTSLNSVAAISGLTGAMFFGFADSAKTNKGFINYDTDTGNYLANFLIKFSTSAGVNFQTAIVKSYDADGFTLTWVKTGSPTGIGSANIICYK